MNILILFKRLWALFVFASMLLALIAKPFLVLISVFFDASDTDTSNGISQMGVDYYGGIHEGPVTSFTTIELLDRD